MPRNIPTQILTMLQTSPVVTLAVLVRIARTDGTIMGFTSWDVPITYLGLVYQPAISMDPSAVKVNADLTTDQMDIIGAIDSVYITDDDIEGGRYDMAQVTVMRINPNNIGWGVIVDLTGYIGQIDYGDGKFQVAVNSLGHMLTQQLGNVVTPACRVQQLGDSQCKVSIATYQTSATVGSNPSGDNRVLIFSSTQQTGYYDFGMVRFKSSGAGGGANHDMNMEVKSSISDGNVTLAIATSMVVNSNGTSNTYALSGGTWAVAVTTPNGVVGYSSPIPATPTASQVQTAIQAASNVGGGNCSVSGSGASFTVTWTGALSGKYILVQGDGSLLQYTFNSVTVNGIGDLITVGSTGGSHMQIELVVAMPFTVNIGDAVILEAGCDRRGVTCRNKFHNLVNFHGDLWVPGNDFLLHVGRPPS